jgi:diguanylate cyclase
MLMLPAVSAVAMLLGSLRARLSHQRAELQSALARIQELATLDYLTGLSNRRRAQELLAAEIARAERTLQPFGVALIDLDHFKRLNDRFGHAGGDEALRRFADEARASVRKVDMVARWGGEEFLILMPETDGAAGQAVINRLRERLEALSVPSAQGEMRFTFSAGVASHLAGQTIADTVARADRALYRAKAGGRNRVEIASADDTPGDVRTSRSSGLRDDLPAPAPSLQHSPTALDGSPAADSTEAAPGSCSIGCH